MHFTKKEHFARLLNVIDIIPFERFKKMSVRFNATRLNEIACEYGVKIMCARCSCARRNVALEWILLIAAVLRC